MDMDPHVDNSVDFPDKNYSEVSQKVDNKNQKIESPKPQTVEKPKPEVGFLDADPWIQKACNRQIREMQQLSLQKTDPLLDRVDFLEEDEEDEEESISSRCSTYIQSAQETAKWVKERLEKEHEEFDRQNYAENQIEDHATEALWTEIKKKFQEEIKRIIENRPLT